MPNVPTKSAKAFVLTMPKSILTKDANDNLETADNNFLISVIK